MGDRHVTSPCPSCGDVARRDVYDIGDGPELSCASCEWCWGASGQPLSPIPPATRDLWDEPHPEPPQPNTEEQAHGT